MRSIEIEEGTPEFVKMAFTSNKFSIGGLSVENMLETMGVIQPGISQNVLDEKINSLREALDEMVYDEEVVYVKLSGSGKEIYFLMSSLLKLGGTFH